MAFSRLPNKIKEQARAAYILFTKNPKHPSLRFKKVHSKKAIYSARISLDCRALAQLEGDECIWFWIGSHDDYDKLLSKL